MHPTQTRDLLRALVAAVGDLVADGPVAVRIRRWSPAGARLAWGGLLAAAVGLGYGAVATAGRPISQAFLVALGLLALVMVFVELVRSELRREHERRALRLPRRVRSRGAGERIIEADEWTTQGPTAPSPSSAADSNVARPPAARLRR